MKLGAVGEASVAPPQPLHAAAADGDSVPGAVAVRKRVSRCAQQPRPQSIHLPYPACSSLSINIKSCLPEAEKP